jgi:fumarate reductase flavoprotein subunit
MPRSCAAHGTDHDRQGGLFRNGPDLQSAVAELTDLLARAQHVAIHHRRGDANPELVLAYRLPRMLKIALTVTLGALNRTESRGAHYREDYTARDDRAWLKRTLARWADGADLPVLSYEALDVAKMELPPGFRGYGVKNIIEHPESAVRQAEVDAVRQADADRYTRQAGLMPYDHLLPAKYRGRNERLE